MFLLILMIFFLTSTIVVNSRCSNIPECSGCLLCHMTIMWRPIRANFQHIVGLKEDRADLAFLLSNMQGEPVTNVAEIPQVIIFHDTISDLEVTRESLELRLAKAGLPKMNGSQRVVEIF